MDAKQHTAVVTDDVYTGTRGLFLPRCTNPCALKSRNGPLRDYVLLYIYVHYLSRHTKHTIGFNITNVIYIVTNVIHRFVVSRIHI